MVRYEIDWHSSDLGTKITAVKSVQVWDRRGGKEPVVIDRALTKKRALAIIKRLEKEGTT